MANQGYKDFTAGAVLTAADLEDYCENQSILRFASAAARDTALSVVKVEGMVAYLIDVNCFTVYTGAAWSTIGPVHGVWTTYAPVWTASGTAPAIGNGSLTGQYMRVGRLVVAQVLWTWGTTTTYGTLNYSFTLPVATGSFGGAGSGLFVRSGAVGWFGLTAYATATASTMTMMLGGTVSNQFYGQAIPTAQATGDGGYVTFTYSAGADA